jgi:hypothetical protein
MEILGRLGPGIHELICAPREGDDQAGLGELGALLSPRVRDGLTRRGIVLCRWADLF